MKILIATGLFPPDIGGPATYSKLLSDELPKGGVEVEVRNFGAVRHLPKVIRHIAYGCSLVWHAREADVVFAQDTMSVGLPSMLAAFVLGKPFVVRVPGDYAWEQAHRFGVTDTMEDFQNKKYGFRIELLRKVQKLIVNYADRVIVPSMRFAEIVRKWVKQSEKVSAIYNGIDVSKVVKLSEGLTYKPKTLISAGRLVPGKGFEALILAMKKLPEWTLVIAGDGPGHAGLQAMIEKESLNGRVSLLGRIDRDALVKEIAGSEIFVLNTAFETFSYQVVEAMAAGTPVITTSVGSLPELIDDGVSGILINPDDEQRLVTAVKILSTDTDMRNRVVSAAKEKALTFSIEETVRETKSVLTNIDLSSEIFLKRRQALAKTVRYLFSGGTAAVTDLVLLYVFTDLLHIWYITSSIMAFILAFGVSFVLQKFFTFQDHGMDGVHGQAAMYFGLSVTNLGINTGLMYLLVQFMHVHYFPAQIIASIAIAIESYVLYGMFIFKNKPGKKA